MSDLKPDREFNLRTDISHFWVPGTIADVTETTKGGVASLVTASSGVGLDDTIGPGLVPVKQGRLATSGINPGTGSTNTVDYVADPSGAVPVGMLLEDIINETNMGFDEPRLRPRDGQDVSFPGRKVTLVREGWLVTNRVMNTPAAGDTAYLAASGYMSPVQATGAPAVGRFETSKDANGFARVSLKI